MNSGTIPASERDLSPQAEKALRELSVIVKSNFKSLQESQIIGRITITSGRTVTNSIKGYKLMRAHGFLPAEFVEKETDGVVLRMIERNPLVLELMDRLGCVIGKTSRISQDANGDYNPPRIRTIEEVRAGLVLKSDF